jgi:hypothetical protein
LAGRGGIVPDVEDGSGRMKLNRDQEKTVEQLDGQFAKGSRNVYFGNALGFGAHLITSELIARRVAAGQRCLVLHPSPGIRIESLKRDQPGLDVGRLGSGAMVEVTNYPTAGHKVAKGDGAFGADRDFLLMEEASAEPNSDRIMAIRKAMGAVPVLVAALAPARNPYPRMDAEVLQLGPEAMKAAMAGLVTVRARNWDEMLGGAPDAESAASAKP